MRPLAPTLVALALGLALGGCAHQGSLAGAPPAATTNRMTTQATRSVAESFYRQALEQKRVRAAFEAFASPEMIEHKADVASGDREGIIRFLEGLMAQLPEARWRMIRSVAEGDMAVIHATMTPVPGAPPYTIADFFRIADGRIVEHWDVVAAPPRDAPNPLPRF